MKTALAFLVCVPLLAQRPSNPALLVAQNAPELDYEAVPGPLALPAGSGAPSATAFDSKGHMFVLTRGSTAFLEFDADGRFIRSFGEDLFTRSHDAGPLLLATGGVLSWNQRLARFADEP